MTRFGFSIDLPVRNDWRNVDVIRSSVQNCFSAVFVDLAGCHALSSTEVSKRSKTGL